MPGTRCFEVVGESSRDVGVGSVYWRMGAGLQEDISRVLFGKGYDSLKNRVYVPWSNLRPRKARSEGHWDYIAALDFCELADSVCIHSMFALKLMVPSRYNKLSFCADDINRFRNKGSRYESQNTKASI